MRVITSIEAPPADDSRPSIMNLDAPGPLWKRLLSFVGLWAAGVLTVGTVAYLIRWWIA